MSKKMDYVIYDGRYWSDPERALIMAICDTRKEAEEIRADYGDDTVIVEEESDEFELRHCARCNSMTNWKTVEEAIPGAMVAANEAEIERVEQAAAKEAVERFAGKVSAEMYANGHSWLGGIVDDLLKEELKGEK